MKLFKKSSICLAMIVALSRPTKVSSLGGEAYMSFKGRVIHGILKFSQYILPGSQCSCDDNVPMRESIYQNWVYDINHETVTFKEQLFYALSTITDAVKIRLMTKPKLKTPGHGNKELIPNKFSRYIAFGAIAGIVAVTVIPMINSTPDKFNAVSITSVPTSSAFNPTAARLVGLLSIKTQQPR